MIPIRQQVVGLGGEAADLYHLLDMLAAGADDMPTSRAITAASKVALRLTHRADQILAMLSDSPVD
jgi:hypothetical protein